MSGNMSQASLNLTSEEKRAYGQLFQEADPDGLGIVTGEVAVRFFERTRLDPTILGVIWQIGDSENRGLLTPSGFSVVLRLIGHAQAGRDPSMELSTSPGPLPRFDGTHSTSSLPTGSQSQGTPGPIRVPPLTPDKVSEYASLFDKAGAQDGLLGGDAARQVFERARLPNEILGQIWNLADTAQKGALNSTDFAIAMHFLTSMRSGAMRSLPQSLPVGLYEAATRRVAPPNSQINTRSFNGNLAQRVQSPTTRVLASPIAQQSTGTDWLVAPRDKAKFDEIFNGIDEVGQGYITGEQAVAFFSDSRLPEEILAQIWDLSDINSEGRLTKDEFAVAMYLIRQERAQKSDNRGALPTSLPAKLVPPSMRQQSVPPSQTTAPAFDNASFASQQPKSAADDLFGLDALSDEAPVQANSVTKSKGSLSSAAQAASTTASVPYAQGSMFKPFMPSSSFGQGLTSQHTGTSVQSQQSQSRTLSDPAEDLLGDNDPEISRKLTSDTTELANMSNQITQLRNQMQDVQAKKTLNEQNLFTTANQKNDLESRLAQFRTQYEKEIREVKGLEERLTTSRNDTRKLQQELAMVEGAHQDLLNQHQHILSSLEADQNENSVLRRRMQQLTLENTQLKVKVEKSKSEARQQKGMVAINKKQVTVNEAEKEKLQAELNDIPRKDRDEHFSEAQREQDEVVELPRQTTLSPATNPFSRNLPHSPFDISTSALGNTDSGPNPFDRFFESGNLATVPNSQPAVARDEDQDKAKDSFAGIASSQASSGIPSMGVVETEAPAISHYDMTPLAPQQSDHDMDHVLPDTEERPKSRAVILDAVAHQSPHNDHRVSPNGQGVAASASDADKSLLDGDQRDSELSSQRSSLAESSIPGAFPGEGIQEPLSNATDGLADAASKENTAEDSESAFVPSTNEQTATATATERNSEFPPIEDVEQEDSDSDTETGFEDNFFSASPEAPAAETSSVSNTTMSHIEASASQKATTGHHADDSSSFTEAPPAAGSQQPPPAYISADRRGSTSNSGRDSNQFPQQYHGLLPSREITNSPPDEIVQNTPQMISSIEPKGSGHEANTASEVSRTALPDPINKDGTVPDDFGDAFDDLTEAQEDAGIDFSDAATGEDSEFSPTFTSHSQGHAISDKVRTESATEGDKRTPNTASKDNFASFEPVLNPPNHDAILSTSTHEKSDWDAIFAGIDRPSATGGASGSKSPFNTEESSTTLLSPRAADSSTEASGNPSRPAVGRAISQGTEHDDPILKTLTNMGYPRDLALKALEKYDYNLDKAADHLASKS